MTTRKLKRRVYCTDALEWLSTHKNLDSIVTSIPEMSELKIPYNQYVDFLEKAVTLCLQATKPNGYVIFLQTDRKHHGLLDKSYFISDVAHKLGYKMLWHKIVLRKEVGKVDLFRPTYSRMLCYTKNGKVGKVFPDVIHSGETTYTNGFGIDAVKLAIDYLKSHRIRTVYDVFVGSGTTLAVANKLGLNAVGVDNDASQCKKAMKLNL